MANSKNPPPKQTKTRKPAAEAVPAGAVDGERSRKTPVLIRLDEDILARVDRVAHRLGLLRTGFIALATVRLLEREERDAREGS